MIPDFTPYPALGSAADLLRRFPPAVMRFHMVFSFGSRSARDPASPPPTVLRVPLFNKYRGEVRVEGSGAPGARW